MVNARRNAVKSVPFEPSVLKYVVAALSVESI